MVAVRRRTRRRRSTSQVKSKGLIILLSLFGALALMIAIPPVRKAAKAVLQALAARVHISAETIALLVAGIALLFLLPGMEDRVLIALGIRKAKRSRNSHR
jgi:hypothetical protein